MAFINDSGAVIRNQAGDARFASISAQGIGQKIIVITHLNDILRRAAFTNILLIPAVGEAAIAKGGDANMIPVICGEVRHAVKIKMGS